MFIHIKSELFRKEVTDTLIPVENIDYIEMYKKIKEGRAVFKLSLHTSDARMCELYSTEEGMRNRLKEIITLIGKNTPEQVETMVNDFMIDDKTGE